MNPDLIAELRAILPKVQSFSYAPNLAAPWLLAQRLPASAPVQSVKAGPLAPLLTRNLARSVVAASGGGELRRADFAAVLDPFGSPAPSAAGVAGQEAAAAARWTQHEVSYTAWGTNRADTSWSQISRPGGNLVVQLSFPPEHARLFRAHFPAAHRKAFEAEGHPVRTQGLPTLAWARLDIDMVTETALVEEVQSDWFRMVDWRRIRLERRQPRTRALKTLQAYQAEARNAFAKGWEEAILLAALDLMVRELGIRRIFMHQPGPGELLKRIEGRAPPVSLYTRLPHRFGFTPTRDAPGFLERPARRRLKTLRRAKGALFWRLDL